MQTCILIVYFFILICIPQDAGAQEAESARILTLKDLYTLALNKNETIATSGQVLRQAESAHRQAIGEALPQINYGRRAALEDGSKTGHNGYFEISKTEFSGYRELAQIQSAAAVERQRRYEKRRQEQLLLQSVASAFYDFLLAEKNVAATKKVLELAEQRLQELEKRVKVGKTRKADALSQEVLASNFNAQLEENKRQAGSKRDLLSYLVVQSLENTAFSDSLAFKGAMSLESYLATAEKRPDIQAAMENVKSFKGLLEVTRADFLPSLDIAAKTYTDRSLLADENVDWDVVLALNVPIWDWAARGAAMDASGAQLTESEKELSLALRQAELEIRDAYRNLISAGNKLKIYEQAVEFARKDYEMQAEDDKQGLVTSLEVLASLDRLNSAELNLNSARLQEKIAVIQLQIAAGSDPLEILQ